MGRRPPGHRTGRRPLRRLLAAVLGLILLAACTSQPGPRQGNRLERLDAAVAGLSTARGALLRAVDDVQAGARALDATDAICVQGRGTAARTSQRAGKPAVTSAGAAVRELPRLVANYRASLTALDNAKSVVSGAPLSALGDVVRDGGAEAAAVARFEGTVTSAWAQYTVLDHEEQLWIQRAVTPWYRNDKEAADAYAVLVAPYRRLLGVARTQMGAASREVMAPTSVQAATLAAADRALSSLRTRRS